MYLRQSTASQTRSIGPFVDDTDFKTLKNGLTVANTDILLKKNGAASAAKNSGGATADGSGGMYHLTFDATDTGTVGEIMGSVKVAGALVVFFKFFVLEEAVYDALFAASAPGYIANAPVNVAQFGGSNGTFASGRPEVNVSHWLGTAAATPTVAGVPEVDVTHLLGTAWLAPGTAGTPDVNVKLWNALTTVALPLTPTTAGRTLDVSATGEAGVDWANVGSPTTTLNLSGTTISTSQAVASVAGNVSGSVASVVGNVGGNVTGSVGSIATGGIAAASFAAGAINAAAIASDAITDAKVASDVTIASVTGAVGSVTGNVGGNVTGSVGSVASGGITAASIADGAIDRATFAADTGLQTIRSNTAQAGANGSITLDASASAVDDFYKNALVFVTGGTGVGQSRTVSGYTGATKVATVTPNWGTNPDNTSTFAVLPAGAVAGASAPTAGEVADAVWDEARAGHVSAGTFGEYTPANVTHFGGTAGTFSGGRPEVNTTHAAGTAWGSGAITAGVIAADAIGASELAADAIAEIADAVWDEDATAHQTQGTFGQAIGDPGADADTIWSLVNTNLDAAVSSRMATYTQPTGFLAATFPTTVASTTNITAGTITTATNVTTVNGLAAGVITAASIATGAIDADALAADAIDEILDEQIGDGTITLRQAIKAILAASAGKLSGAATTTVTIRNTADTANVIVATVDADGNRSAVTLNV